MLKNETDLKSDFSPGVFREHSADKMQAYINSVFAVGGAMSCDDYSMAIDTPWAPFSQFTDSKDTKGLTETLAEGKFTLEAGADGKYFVIVTLVAISPIPSWVQLGIFRNTNLLQKYRRTFPSGGEEKEFTFFGGGNFNSGDDMSLGIKASEALTITGEICQMGCFRV